MDSYMRMFTDDEIYMAKVTIKSFLNSAVDKIKQKLNASQLAKFKTTCFGHFLEANELQFSGQVVNHMLWRQCTSDDTETMVFNFGGNGAIFSIQEFCLITGLYCGPIPSKSPASSDRFRNMYFGNRKLPLHNNDIAEVFDSAICENENDMVRLALLYFLETVILSKEKPTPVPIERIDMVEDLEYFLNYPWGTVSYRNTIQSMRGCPARRQNSSRTYSLTGFPLAFMVSIIA